MDSEQPGQKISSAAYASFGDVIRENCCYVDKTLFIRDFLLNHGNAIYIVCIRSIYTLCTC